MTTLKIFAAMPLAALFFSCGSITGPTHTGPLRTFQTSFESLDDFKSFYIETAANFGSGQELVSGSSIDPTPIDGQKSHKSWIVKATDTDNNSYGGYKPHRAYPTIQLQKTTEGSYRTPCLVTLYVWLDMVLTNRSGINDWFSFATLTPDASDLWVRTVVVNVGPDGYVRLVHVPNQGEQIRIYQVESSDDSGGSKKFPVQQWVRLDIFCDFSEQNGYAKVWQNRLLISHAKVSGGKGALAQAHFGLYASAAIAAGRVYNDKLRIQEVKNEAQAQVLVDGAY